jgi:hypothetical protein
MPNRMWFLGGLATAIYSGFATFRTPKYNYHILRQFGETWVFYWPAAGWGETCTSLFFAKRQLKAFRQANPQDKYKLVWRDLKDGQITEYKEK